MKNSDYEKYCPFNFFDNEIYDSYKKYFTNLLNQLVIFEKGGSKK